MVVALVFVGSVVLFKDSMYGSNSGAFEFLFLVLDVCEYVLSKSTPFRIYVQNVIHNIFGGFIWP